MYQIILNQDLQKALIRFTKNLIEPQPELLLELSSLIKDKGVLYFEVDLSEVDYMNSTGLNVLLSILTKSRTVGGDVTLKGVNTTIANLLLITKLNQLFDIQDASEA